VFVNGLVGTTTLQNAHRDPGTTIANRLSVLDFQNFHASMALLSFFALVHLNYGYGLHPSAESTSPAVRPLFGSGVNDVVHATTACHELIA
jgi:hypothetical protein